MTFLGASTTRITNRTIMITRPAHQAAKLCQLINQSGAQVITFPTMAIEAISINEQPQLLTTLKQFNQQDIAIFISPNAVQATHTLIQQQNLVWPNKVILAAVGASTAASLAELGLTVGLIPTTQFNSEGLLALPALQTVQAKRIIIFKGEGGRDLLSTALQQRGAMVTESAVYRRVLPQVENMATQLAQWQADGIDIIVCTSNTGLENLITLMGETARNWLLNMPLLVISERMAEFAKALGFVKTPIVADNATDEAILQALVNYF